MSLKAKVVSSTNERATLEFEDGQMLTVPLTAIEGQPKSGMEVALVVAALGAEDAGRQAIARDLLNNLLSS